MTVSVDRRRIALAGNPNTGKTTLFNRLTGGRGRVGNYPGVTVEHEYAEIELERAGRVLLEDVPGTYSLSARSEEEQIAIQTIAGLHPLERPDAVLVVIDATQLLRNLYLALQLVELDLPLVIAVNMADMLEARGLSLDVAALQRELGVEVVAISALRGEGLDELRAALDRTLAENSAPSPSWLLDNDELVADLEHVVPHVPEAWHRGNDVRRLALARWAIVSIDEDDELRDTPEPLRQAVFERRAAAAKGGREIEAEIIQGRYDWIDRAAPNFLRERETDKLTRTDRVDRVLLNPFAGFALFLLLMAVVFQSLFSWSDPFIGLIETLFGWLAGHVQSLLPDGLLSDFIVEALIAGVGNVLVFIPQIALLFVFIGLMEDSGYMARVAVLMDRTMRSIGLHGRAFVPMLSGFACAIPAILATRTMERKRDRMLTMMVVPLMTCSARLPVYALLIGALFPPDRIFGVLPIQGLMMVGMYLFSTLLALVVAAVLGRTLFKGKHVPLLIELPPYRLPHLPTLAHMVWNKTSVFIREAGTVILVMTVGMWLLLSFPKNSEISAQFAERRAEIESSAEPEVEDRLAVLDSEEQGELKRASYAGRIGRAIEPTIAPLGFDWKIGIGLLGAFAAREVFVSTMGVVYGIGEDVDEESVSLRQRIRAEAHANGAPVYTPLVGLSLMIFFAIACQCMSTIAVVKRETRSWRWPTFLFVYTAGLAWFASFVCYQVGSALGF